MVLHSIVPMEQIFAGTENQSYSYQRMNNSFVEGTTRNGRFTVERLISTDPSLYLDPRFSPGGMYGGGSL